MHDDLVRRGYDRMVHDYLAQRDQFTNLPHLEDLAARLHPGASVLDIGCGAGVPVARFLVERGFAVMGLDVSPVQVALAQEHVPQATFVVRDMYTLQPSDYFEQRVQRPKQRSEADGYYSGKKKQHTFKSQIAVDQLDGTICDVSDSVEGPTADIRLLKQSGLMERLPEGVGGMGDKAYVGIDELQPQGLGLTPRRKPPRKPRPPEEVCFKRACAKRRMPIEHTIGRLRRYQCLNQTDRHHRKNHSARVRAVAGLVNRQIRARRAQAA